MQLADITRIHHEPLYPSISLLANLAAASDDPVVALRSQVPEVRERLSRELDERSTAQLVDLVERTIDQVQSGPDAMSVGVFVNAREQRWLALPLTVRERVIIDSTFATRDVVRWMLRGRRYRVLTIGQRCQLFEGLDDTVVPIDKHRFPLHFDPPPADQERARRRDRSDSERRRLRVATRALDAALDDSLRSEQLPLIVIGLQPRLSYFTRHSRHRRAISATAVGTPDSLADVVGLVQPFVDELYERSAADALQELDRAASARRLATGIDEIFELSNQGRGDLLVVEEDFEYPAAHRGRHVHHAPDPRAPEVVDDLVDEVIEAVLAHRGRVVMVPGGTLDDPGGVRLALRF
jgi:hypothetical protein